MIDTRKAGIHVREDFKMLNRYVTPVIGVVAILTFSFGTSLQTAPLAKLEAAKIHKAARPTPRPVRDLGSRWRQMEGILPTGV